MGKAEDVLACLTSGVCLGIIAGARLLIRGQILGISGYLSRSVRLRNIDASKAWFLLGLVAVGAGKSIIFTKADQLTTSITTFKKSMKSSTSQSRFQSSYSCQRQLVAESWSGLELLLEGAAHLDMVCVAVPGFLPEAWPLRESFTLRVLVDRGLEASVDLLHKSTFHPDLSLCLSRAIMMASGIISLKSFGSSQAVSVAKSRSSTPEGMNPVLLLGACVVHSLLFALAGRRSAIGFKQGPTMKEESWPMINFVLSAGDFSQGILFALALVKSACSIVGTAAGMTQPQKVVGALDVGGLTFDPSLYYVMAGAFLGALPAFGTVFKFKLCNKSISGTSIPVPPSRINLSLLSGALLFGIGWGLCGLCPGPAVVNLLQGSVQSFAFYIPMMSMLAIVPRRTE